MLSQAGRLPEKVWQNSDKLVVLSSISRGEEYGKRSLTAATTQPHTTPIMVGEDVSRYSIRYPSHCLESGAIAKKPDNYSSPKVVVVKTGSRVVAALDGEGLCTLQSVYNVRPRAGCPVDIRYILGIVNSSLISAYIRREVTAYKKIFPQLNQRHIAELPIRRVALGQERVRALHDRLVGLVERMLELHERLAAKGEARDEERAQIEREIEQADRGIDDLVYDLYGLTQEERATVENESRR